MIQEGIRILRLTAIKPQIVHSGLKAKRPCPAFKHSTPELCLVQYLPEIHYAAILGKTAQASMPVPPKVLYA